MPELDERKRIIDYDTVNDPDENYYVLADNGTEGTGKVNVKKIGPGNMISDAYSDQDTYAVGDVCIHNNILYVCNTEIDTPHAFDLSEWDPDTLGNYCSKLNGDVSEIKSSLSQKMSGTFTLLTNMTTIDTDYNLDDDVTNYMYIVALLYYGDFVLTTTDIPIDLWNTTTKVIVNYNDGTIRKGQFTILSNTKVHTALSSAGWSNISGVKLYGVK